MTDTGAVCLAIAIVVAAGLVYLAAKTYTETAVNVASANAAQGAHIPVVNRVPFGFDLSVAS